MRAHMATRRAFPWRTLLQLSGIVLSIGGGIVAVSTPAVGGIVFGFGLLALIASATE
jgi:hypothetical protein